MKNESLKTAASKDSYLRIRPEQIKFSHPLFKSDKISRSLARVVSYTFFIVISGAVIAGLISDVGQLRWAALLAALMVADYLAHFRSSPYSVREFMAGKVPDNNIALCASREVIHYLTSAFERAGTVGGDVYLVLMLELIDKPSIEHALKRLDVPIRELRRKVEDELAKSAKEKQPAASPAELTERIKKLLTLAAFKSDFHLRRSIESDVVFGVLAEIGDARINRILDIFSVDPDDIDSALVFGRFLRGRFKIPVFTGGFAIKNIFIKPSRVNRTFTSRPTPALDAFSKDMTDLARAGVEGFLIGHQKEYDQMVDALSRPGSRNVLLVGEPGVGKESLVAHLAFNIVSDNVPAPLFDRRLVALSIGDLVSGTDLRELSLRLGAVVKEIKLAGNIIIYIPEIHQLEKTSQAGGMDLADFLMPIIKSDAFPVIGATYPKEYKEFIETKTDFSSTFEILRVSEITPREAITLLSYDAIVYEKQYAVTIHFSAIKQSVNLAAKYFHYKPLPASARDLFKETLAMATQRGLKEVTGDNVIEIVERKINVPIHKTGKAESQMLLNLEKVIHQRYINQEEAVMSVSEALRAYRSGLSRKGGPIATFLFVGPTGVGKTELSKILADIQFGSEKSMIRFDMSEYQQKESVSRFIGSPDGKIAGALTESIIQKPYSLILLDEFEKAHPDILNLFLQVFDDGRLTDSLGRVVDFQNTIIIATSNAQSVYIQEKIRSGISIDQFADELKKKLFEYFKPELINRFSEVVIFSPLSVEDIKKIARLNLKTLAETLSDSQGIEMSFDDAIIGKIAAAGYDPAFGARPLRKAVDEMIKSALSKKILSQELIKGQKVEISADDSGAVFNIIS
jgi:ATP-dependent Clp protease ATP-binding subunit ClpC